MSDVVIKAEGLGKKYVIGHQAENGSYLALRDVVMHNARGLWHKTRDLAQGKPIILGNSTEEIWALKNVSFEIRRGEAVGIIGRNGAGKSTLLKVLSRITEPSAGRVTIKGRVASLLEVGTGFHPELTGRENIYLNGAILGMTRAEIKRKFDEIVDFAEIEKFLDTPVKRYSSGMYVRLAFAVAAHLEPEILVVDEVLAVGDAAFQKKSLGKMSDVAKEGRTVLFVSHNMAAISRICGRGLLLSEGGISRDGSPTEIVDHYLSGANDDVTLRVTLGSPERKGNGLARIESIVGFDELGNQVKLIVTGTRCTLGFRYSSVACPLDIHFAFGLTNSLGEYCLHCSTATLNQKMTLVSPQGWIVCKFTKLPLLPGIYSVNFKLDHVGGDVIDYVQNAASIEIGEGDYYGSGRLPSLGLGSVLADYEYSAL